MPTTSRATAAPLEVLSDAQQLIHALPPLRRRMLELLAEPASAAGLARQLELPRQKLNYHLRELERAGLVELVEQRQRRGLIERRFRTTARAWVVDPAVLGELGTAAANLRDRFSSAYLIATAARLIRSVAALRERAGAANQRLATLTLETEIAFGSPRDLRAFTRDLQACIAELTARYQHPGGRRYQLVVASHPSITRTEDQPR
jgi:DNA-binding transcriptional ArsR family regulator